MGPSATPTASPTLIPTPSPTPMPLPESFEARVAAGDFRAQGSVVGTVKVNLIIGSSSGPIIGTFKVKGGDSAASISTKVLGTTIAYDSIVVGGWSYSRTNGGQWSRSPATGKTLQDFVGSGISLTDAGVETKFGRQLHHLTVADVSGLDPSGFGISAGPDQKNLMIESLSFWSADDGTPAGLSVAASLDQKLLGTPTHETVTLDIAIDTLSGVTIEPPAG